ncbi:MAG TPA: hypothetical protein VHX39_06285 [Acetobacteraceae bacterium]|nr:hypothetical protein [Acetobacteraceae bacterium]
MPSVDLLWVCAAAWFGSFAGMVAVLLRVKAAIERLIEKDIADNNIAGVDVEITVRHA